MGKSIQPKLASKVLQGRDILLLEFLAKFGAVNEAHLMQLLNVSNNSLKSIINRLSTNTYITKQRLIANEYAYIMLDKPGAKLLMTKCVKTLALNTLKHDMLVIDVYFDWLKRNPDSKIQSERELKIMCGIKVGDKKKVPDLLVDECIAIEVELTEKSNARLVEIISNYVNDTKICEVYYFVKSKTLGSKILHLAGLHKKFKVLVLNLGADTLEYEELILTNSGILSSNHNKSPTSFDLDAYLAKDWGD